MGFIKFLINRIFDSDDGMEEFDDVDDLDDFDDTGDVDDSDDFEPTNDPDDLDEPFGAGEQLEELTTFPRFNSISFTGLIDKGLKESNAYQSWLDGVSPKEIRPDDIQEIAEHIADEFSQAIPDVQMNWFKGGFATTMEGNGTIFYDVAAVIRDTTRGYGANNIVGSIAHEMGHNIVERVFSDGGIELTRLQHEIGADYMEGVVFGMSGVDPQEKFAWLREMSGSSANYLSAEGRIDVIERGIQWGERLRFVGANAPEMMADVGNSGMLRKMLRNVMKDYTDI